MKFESVEQYLARGGYVMRIIDTREAYTRKRSPQHVGKFLDDAGRETLKKNEHIYNEATKQKIKGLKK